MGRREAVDGSGVGLLVVLGRGGDRLAEHVLANRPRVRRILVIDSDPAAGRGLAASEPDRLAVVTDPTGRDLGAKLHMLLRQVGWLRYLRTMHVSPPAPALDPAWASVAISSLKAAAVASLNYYGNDPGDALLGLRHIVANLTEIAASHDFGPLRGALEGRTAVVASAGPSLDDALGRLAEVQDELCIVAPDTSLKPLIDRGVRPHVVTCKERTERTIPLLEGVDAEGIVLVALPVIPPAVLPGWSGTKVAAYSGGSHFPWLGAIGAPRSVLRFDGSAGNMAFRVCEELGAARIVLVGQDLAFGPDGRTHVGGAANPKSQAIHKAMKRIQIPGIAGRPVWSTPTWREFVQAYEVDLQRYAGECLNTSPAGAYLRGARHVTLDEALAERGAPYEARRVLADRLGTPPAAADLAEGLRRSRAVLATTAELCAQGVEAASTPTGPAGAGADVDDLLVGPLAEVSRVRAQLLRQPLFHELLTPVVQSVLLQRETGIYGLQRQGLGDRDLLEKVGAGWAGWFAIIAKLAEATGAELPSEA